MGCAFYGGGSFVDGMNDRRREAVLINVANNLCVTTIGTYPITCQYWTNVDTGRLYTTLDVLNPGSITFASVSEQYMAGTFSAVCKKENLDSVIVSESFKGIPGQ